MKKAVSNKEEKELKEQGCTALSEISDSSNVKEMTEESSLMKPSSQDSGQSNLLKSSSKDSKQSSLLKASSQDTDQKDANFYEGVC